jgi:hypothetical protein
VFIIYSNTEVRDQLWHRFSVVQELAKKSSDDEPASHPHNAERNIFLLGLAYSQHHSPLNIILRKL